MGAAGAHRDSRSYGSSGRVAPGRNRIALSAARRPRSLPARDDSRPDEGGGSRFRSFFNPYRRIVREADRTGGRLVVMVSAFRAISSTSSQNENKKVARPCGLENPTPARQTPQSLPLIRPLAARLRRQSIYWSRKQSPPPPVSAPLSLPARSSAPHRSFRLPSHRAGPDAMQDPLDQTVPARSGRRRRSHRGQPARPVRAVVCAAP